MQNQVNQSDIDRFFTIDVILLSTFIFFQLFFREIYESMPSITLSISGILNVGICIYLFIFPFLIKKFRKEQNWRFSAALTRTFCLLPLTLGNMSFVRQALGTNMLLYSFIGISIFGLIFMTGEIVSRKNAFKFLSVPLVLGIIMLIVHAQFKTNSYNMPFDFKIAIYVLLGISTLGSLYALVSLKEKYVMRYLVGGIIVLLITFLWQPGQVSADIINAFMKMK